MKEILVLGIGNLILRDEGVGIHAIDYLQQQRLPSCVDLLDGGTGGLSLIGTLQEYRRVILIDATLDENPPGMVRHLQPRYIHDFPPLLSAHEIGLREMLEAMMVQEKMPEIDLIVVSVSDINTVGMALSPEVEEAIPRIGELVHRLIHTYI